MKLFKRIVCLMLVLALALCLCACNAEIKDGDETGETTAATTTAPTNAEGGNLDGDAIYNDAELDWG